MTQHSILRATQAPDDIHELLGQMLDLVNHLQLADQYLQGRFAQLDDDIQPAATVLNYATGELDALHSALDAWSVHHTHLPRAAVAEALGATGGEEAAEPQSADGALASAATLLRAAATLFGDGNDDAQPDLEDVAELVRTAEARLLAWTKTIVDEDGGPAFDALDACTAVTTLIQAGNPRNTVSISPIRGVLWMAVERLESAQGQIFADAISEVAAEARDKRAGEAAAEEARS